MNADQDETHLNKLTIWTAINQAAAAGGLDTKKFRQEHIEVVNRIIDFLAAPPLKMPAPVERKGPKGFSKKLLAKAPWLAKIQTPPPPPAAATVSPIVICGEPGTGKTTFLSVLDIVLRQSFRLPDPIQPLMTKANGRTHTVYERAFNNQPLSLLSVKKWAQLLHFYAWDVKHHRLDNRALVRFIQTTLG